MDNLAYQDEYRSEMLHGKIFMMSRPSVNHNQVAFNIAYAFRSYLKGKPCRAFADGTDVYLSETDRVIPDVMIVCNKDIIKMNGIHGAPDMVVEVLSPRTAKNDRGYKKDLYEQAGVKEYWIVEPETRSVEVYLLSDGKYKLDKIYRILPDYVELDEDEKDDFKDEVPVSLYDDLLLPLEDIFYNLL